MSGVFKAIGKAFKAVAKVAKVVLPIALAVGAVVFTGGAALGILPTFSAAVGGVVGSLGLSTALAGALTGAVVSAGFGSAFGGAKAAISGQDVMKGMQGGALTGAVTGGLLGGLSPSTFGIVKGVDGVTTMNALKNGGNAFAAAGSKTALSTVNGITSVAAPAAGAPSAVVAPGSWASEVTGGGISDPVTASGGGLLSQGATPVAAAGTPLTAAPTVAAAAPAATAPAGGIGGFISANPMLAGNLISGVAGAVGGGGNTAADQYAARQDAEEESSRFAYGGAYAGKTDPFGVRAIATPPRPQASDYYAAPNRRWQYDANTNSIVEVKA